MGLRLAALIAFALGLGLATGASWSQNTNTGWQPLGERMIASLLVRRTLVLADGRQLYLLPSGSAYQEHRSFLSYQRWGVLGNRLCLQDRERRCYGVTRSASGLLLLTDPAGQGLYANLFDGDPSRLVWRYGLSLRDALQTGQVRLARKSGDSVSADGAARPARSLAQRSTPFAPRRATLETSDHLPRQSRSGEAVANDGTVGRFATRPQGQPSILPHYAQPTPTQGAAPVADGATEPSAAPAPTASAPPLQLAAPSVPIPSVLFSELIDRDPGCYAQRQRCLSRCLGVSQSYRSVSMQKDRCSTNCLDTYICSR